MAKQKNISIPKIGMNRSLSPHMLSEQEYAFQLNGNSYDEGGEKFNLTDEHSNILASRFKEGFKFVGGRSHVVREKTYIFLTNPTTGVSEIGCIRNTTDFTILSDTESLDTCQDCGSNFENIEATPLEQQVQVEHQVYETLLEDSCNLCLGFDINHPILDIIVKEENIGTTLWWTSTPGNKEFRYLEVDNLDQYRLTGDDNCGATPTATCLDCDKLRVFPLYTELKVKDYQRTVGGNLKKGAYEILGAYSDILGNEFTSYTLLTPIIPIFDEANVIHEQEDNNAETNFAIKVNLDTVDVRFEHYKVVVRYYTSKGVFTSFVEGIHGTSDKAIILSNNNGESISNQKISLKKPFIETVDGATSSNDILVLTGVREREPINLQPVVSLAGLGVQWMSFRAKESLYSNADSYQYLSYNRDENIALSIDFGFKDGYRSNSSVFIPRPPTTDELSDFNTGDDYNSINDIVGSCDGTIRSKKWQFYNTATEIGACPLNSNIPTVNQTETVTTYTETDVPQVTANTLLVSLENVDQFINLTNFIEDNIDNAATLTAAISPFVDLANLTAFNNVPSLPAATCNTFGPAVEEQVIIGEVQNEQVVANFKTDVADYTSIVPPQNIPVFEKFGETSKINDDFSYAYNSDGANEGANDNRFTPRSRKRSTAFFNTKCVDAADLLKYTGGSNTYGYYHHNNQGALTIAELQEPTVNMPATVQQGTANSTDGIFTDKLHTTALWFKGGVDDRDKFFVNISKRSSCERESIDLSGLSQLFGANKTNLLRVSIFDTCNDTAPIYSEIVDISQSTFITMDNTILSALTSNTYYVSIETSIKQATGLGPDYETNGCIEDNSTVQSPRSNCEFVTTFIANIPCGIFSIVDRDQEAESFNVSWDSITLSKRQKYETTCTFEVPVLSDCEPVPYKYGELGYYESTDKYPDNKELYDSSSLVINKSTITNTDLLNKLTTNYTETDTGTQLILSTEADFRCKNIRHYKLPDNKISPFIRDENIASNSDSIISPLGFTIDGEVINNLLDVAVDNSIITQQQRDDIVDYKIYRADTTLDRSVVASGLVYNSKSYVEDGEEVNYFNYPFNSLGKDKYFPNNTDAAFDKIQVISPEFDYFNPSLPDEMSIQGYMFGKSNSRVLPVDDHSKMVILGDKARKLANTLAILEVTAEIIIEAAQAASNAQVWAVAGLGSTGASLGLPAFIASGTILAIGVVEGLVSKVARYRLQWEQSFENLGSPYNFGHYTSSGSNYNYLKPLQTDGDRLRGLSVGKYLKSGLLNVSDTTSGNIIKINNIDREEAPFFSLGNYPIQNLDPEYENFDNSDTSPNFSSQILSSEVGCHEGKSPEKLRNIASPYAAFKNFIPNQYGTIDSIKWVDTTYCIPIENTGVCNGILGGDTFISRHSKKRKARMFETDLLGSADLTPFPYKFNANYGEPRFYIDYKVNSDFQTGSRVFPNIFYDVQFDCASGTSGFYVEPPGKFYLYSIAFTNFLCETRINTNFRNARKEPWNQFYPQNTDYEAITQPTTVSMTRGENFFYNKAYLQTSVQNTVFGLPEYYSAEDEAKKAYNVNSGIYSIPDVNENSITEPWLLYRPNDKFTLKSRYGNLINMKGIESGQILMHFEDALQLQNAVNEFTDGSTQYNTDLGNGGMFAKRAITLRSTDIGYGGTQSKNTLSCEFGHFHADLKRGQVFNYIGGNDLQEISRYSNGKPNGMDVWFKEHLPLKFSRRFPSFINLDNPYNGVGIHWGYDSKYRRVILTKKDYVLAEGVKLEYDPVTNTFDGNTTFQDRVDDGSFKDVSWTITFKPETGAWESYMSYTPNYYINHTDYFQSGINSNDDTFGLWSHLLTNKSYRVFYGKKYPYIFEYPIKNEYFSKTLEHLSWNAVLRRYHNNYDYATIVENPFSSVNIYNNYENSGNLIPVLNNGTLSQLSKYPISNSADNTQEILVSYDNYRYKLDYIYNRVKSNINNQPVWLWDENQINKRINPKAVSFYGKSTLERLKGNFFMVRLERNGNTNHDLDFRWSEQTVNPIR